MEEFRAIKTEELEECLDLWGEVFTHTSREYFPPYFYGDPWFKPEYARVCIADGKIASAVQICERRVLVGESEFIMGGIGNVATYPEYRGKGYSSKLMLDTVNVMLENGMDFSVLFTGIQPFYEKAGWRAVPIKTLSGRIRNEFQVLQVNYDIRLCDWETDLVGIMSIHEIFNQARPLATVRTPEFWKGYALERFRKESNSLIAEKDGDAKAYLFFNHDAENCWLQEVGYLPEDEPAVWELFSHVAVQMRGKGVQRMNSNLPFEPILVQVFDRICENKEVNKPSGMMCRIINAESLASKALPELKKRAVENGLEPLNLIIETELGALNINLQDDEELSEDNISLTIQIGQSEFFTLLFGIESVEELELPISNEAKRILSVLFPPQTPIFWRVDHF